MVEEHLILQNETNECGLYLRLKLPVSYELYISKRQLMNNSDIVHMVEMATTQPSSTG